MRSSTAIEDRLIALLRSPRYRPAKDHEIARELGLEGGERAAFRALLRRLEREGRLECLRKNRWALVNTSARIAGTLTVAIASGLGFVSQDAPGQPDILIEEAQRGTAMHGDRVEVEVTATRGDKLRGRVVRVIDRRSRRLSGLLRRTKYYDYIIPTNARLASEVRIGGYAAGLEATREFSQVVVELDDDPEARWLTGRVVECLGEPGTPGVDVVSVMRDHGLYQDFDDPVTRQARRTPRHVDDDARRDRRDLRELAVLTIDPEDAKDFDDAVSLERNPDGTWSLGVHIADVAHFVPQDSPVDREALHRGTSVYMVDRHIPMLPGYLTSEVCSLRPHEDRLTHSVRLTLDAEGRVLGHETFRSVIHSQLRLNYDQVQLLLDNRDGHEIPPPFIPRIHEMWNLAQLVRRRRMRQGALDLSMPEIKCILDEDGRAVEIRKRGAAQAYQLIEEFMLLANVAVAQVLARREVPALYRIHEPPDDEQWENMSGDLAALGLREHPTNARELSLIARRAAGTPLEYSTNLALLRNLKRALYSPARLGHFGLAFDDYTHFTSPIRRFPDLMVHRMLVALEEGRPPPYRHDDVARMAAHCSRCERNADEAEDESLIVKRIAFYEDRLRRGETGPYSALIVQVVPRGLIVELIDTLQRGLVSLASMQGDRFHAEPAAGQVSARHGKRYRIGMVIEVDLVRVDTHRRLVDFELAGTRRAARRTERRERRRQRRR